MGYCMRLSPISLVPRGQEYNIAPPIFTEGPKESVAAFWFGLNLSWGNAGWSSKQEILSKWKDLFCSRAINIRFPCNLIPQISPIKKMSRFQWKWSALMLWYWMKTFGVGRQCRLGYRMSVSYAPSKMKKGLRKYTPLSTCGHFIFIKLTRFGTDGSKKESKYDRPEVGRKLT